MALTSTELRQLSGGALVQVLSPAHKTNHLQTWKKIKAWVEDIWVLGWKTISLVSMAFWQVAEGAELSWKVCAVVDYEWFSMTWEENRLLREMQRDEGKETQKGN